MIVEALTMETKVMAEVKDENFWKKPLSIMTNLAKSGLYENILILESRQMII